MSAWLAVAKVHLEWLACQQCECLMAELLVANVHTGKRLHEMKNAWLVVAKAHNVPKMTA
eukprot:11298722-Karenia_brevis.AAC.1